MRKVSQTAVQILDLADTHYATSMSFDDADKVTKRDNTTVSEWFLLSSDDAEVTIKIVEDFTLERVKTSDLAAILKALELSRRKTLLVVPKTDESIWKSGRNMPLLHVIEASKASTYEILDNQTLLIQKSAVELLEKALQ